MKKLATLVVLGVLVLLLLACGSDGAEIPSVVTAVATPTPTRAVITVVATPEPPAVEAENQPAPPAQDLLPGPGLTPLPPAPPQFHLLRGQAARRVPRSGYVHPQPRKSSRLRRDRGARATAVAI